MSGEFQEQERWAKDANGWIAGWLNRQDARDANTYDAVDANFEMTGDEA